MKRILITGASRGIGRAMAEKLAAPETTLILQGRDETALQATRDAVKKRGASADIAICDFADSIATAEWAARMARESLDVLINNAGIAVVKPFDQISLDEWQRTFAINVTAPFLLIQSFARGMVPGASIVNILSIAARTGFPAWSSYSMSKFALEGFSQSVREELRSRGVRVINIYPAATNTEIWNSMEGEWPREKMMTPRDVANAVAYVLACPEHVTIENLSLSTTSGTL